MPLIRYACVDCGTEHKQLFRSGRGIPSTLICDKCNGSMRKVISAPSSTSKIVVDNGFQARAVEITPNIVEINEERSKKDYRED